MFQKLDAISLQVKVIAKTCGDSYHANDYAQDQLNDELKTLVEELDKMNLEMRGLKKENASLKTTVESLNTKMEMYDNKFENLDRDSKKSNLCIDEVIEKEDLSLLKVVNDLFRDLGLNLRAEEVCQSGPRWEQAETNHSILPRCQCERTNIQESEEIGRKLIMDKCVCK